MFTLSCVPPFFVGFYHWSNLYPKEFASLVDAWGRFKSILRALVDPIARTISYLLDKAILVLAGFCLLFAAIVVVMTLANNYQYTGSIFTWVKGSPALNSPKMARDFVLAWPASFLMLGMYGAVHSIFLKKPLDVWSGNSAFKRIIEFSICGGSLLALWHLLLARIVAPAAQLQNQVDDLGVVQVYSFVIVWWALVGYSTFYREKGQLLWLTYPVRIFTAICVSIGTIWATERLSEYLGFIDYLKEAKFYYGYIGLAIAGEIAFGGQYGEPNGINVISNAFIRTGMEDDARRAAVLGAAVIAATPAEDFTKMVRALIPKYVKAKADLVLFKQWLSAEQIAAGKDDEHRSGEGDATETG